MRVKLTSGHEAVINPRRVISAVFDGDDTATVMMDGFCSIWGQYTNNIEYEIDSESYQRIAEYMDKLEGEA